MQDGCGMGRRWVWKVGGMGQNGELVGDGRWCVVGRAEGAERAGKWAEVAACESCVCVRLRLRVQGGGLQGAVMMEGLVMGLVGRPAADGLAGGWADVADGGGRPDGQIAVRGEAL